MKKVLLALLLVFVLITPCYSLVSYRDNNAIFYWAVLDGQDWLMFNLTSNNPNDFTSETIQSGAAALDVIDSRLGSAPLERWIYQPYDWGPNGDGTYYLSVYYVFDEGTLLPDDNLSINIKNRDGSFINTVVTLGAFDTGLGCPTCFGEFSYISDFSNQSGYVPLAPPPAGGGNNSSGIVVPSSFDISSAEGLGALVLGSLGIFFLVRKALIIVGKS